MSYRNTTGALWAAAVILAVVFSSFAITPATATAIAPHVSEWQDPDTCATCHRAHTAAGSVEAIDPLGTRSNALIVGTFGSSGEGDTQLCYSCHGLESLGAEDSVQTEFELESAHVLAPATSGFGPTSKQCSSCHDSHGSSQEPTSPPPAALLRSLFGQSKPVLKGDEYCATCHADREHDIWDGLAVWKQTAHADVTPTASGTQVVCSVCHEPHGSSRPPLIVGTIAPPSVAATVGVPANDRWLCYTCHPGGSRTYPGGLVMQASGHGSSATTVSAEGEWASRLATDSPSRLRRVGECQNCHAPMGADDGQGAPIDRLAKAEGKALCFDCHGVGTTIAEDIASVNPAPTAATLEVVSGYGSDAGRREFGTMQLFARASANATSVVGPRQFLRGSVGQVDAGDLDGDGVDETVVSRSGSSSVTIMSYSPLSGLAPVPGDRVLLTEAEHLAIADVRDDVVNAKEIVVTAGNVVSVYRLDPTDTSVDWLSSVTVTGTVPTETPRVTGIATGVFGASQKSRIVVTADAGEGAPVGTPGYVYVLSAESGSLAITATWSAADPLPRGPSVGDVDGNGTAEIAVANGSATATRLFSLYSATGVPLGSGGGAIVGAERAFDTLIADILPAAGLSGQGAEVVLAVSDPAGPASVRAYSEQAAAWDFLTVDAQPMADHSNPGALAVGDVDGDQALEIAVVGSGSWAQSVAARTAVIDVNAAGTSMIAPQVFMASGTQHAGSPASASVAIGNLGTIGKSRHPVGAVPDKHVSTETLGFARHVECVDCHNPHEATETVAPAGAPSVYGALKGTWGVAVTSIPSEQLMEDKRPVEYEYELCFKCHGGWSAPGYGRDIADEIDPGNASVHAIMAPSTTAENWPGTFKPDTTWSASSVLYCADCHGTDKLTGAQGPHASEIAPLLKWGMLGTPNVEPTKLCFNCHNYDVYYTGTQDQPRKSGFYTTDPAVPGLLKRLHQHHTKLKNIGCETCHFSHGSDLPHLLRNNLGYVHTATGGSCTNGCHGGAQKTYTRP